MKNILGIEVTKPNHEIIIMAGVSGSGKSTRAKELQNEKEAVRFSTDDMIILYHGDYRLFFEQMIEKNDFSPLHKMHQKNFHFYKTAIDKGIPRIIVDNTNIKPWEPKEYVMYALNNGYSNENIKFELIGTAGLSAEELTERNTHGVPLDKIRSMMDSYNAHSPLTLEKVIEAKNPHDRVLYSAVVLDQESKEDLLMKFKGYIPEDWSIFNHHMTIIFGKELPEDMKEYLGREIELTVTHFAVTNMVVAVKVDGCFVLTGKPAHITIAVNTKENGKPAMSGDIVEWIQLDNLSCKVKGIVKEIRS